jgi:hypothetical protein
MAKLDRLGWTAGVTFRSYGVRIGIRTTDPAVLETIAAQLPPGAVESRARVVDRLYSIVVGGNGPRAGVTRYHLLYVGSARICRSREFDDVLTVIEPWLAQDVALGAPRRLFVHAGAVGWQGRAIVLPGASGSGKSELVRALVERGARYYSDEYTVLDARGRVHPFARGLRLDAGDGTRTAVPLRELTGRLPGRRPLPIGLVVATRYAGPGRGVPRLRPLTPGETALELFRHVPAARSRGAEGLATLARAVEGTTGLTGPRGEAAAAADHILSMPPPAVGVS